MFDPEPMTEVTKECLDACDTIVTVARPRPDQHEWPTSKWERFQRALVITKAAFLRRASEERRRAKYVTELLSDVTRLSIQRFRRLKNGPRGKIDVSRYGWSPNDPRDLTQEAHRRMLEWVDECKPVADTDWAAVKRAAGGHLQVILEEIINEARRYNRRVTVNVELDSNQNDNQDEEEDQDATPDCIWQIIKRSGSQPLGERQWTEDHTAVATDALDRIRRSCPADLLEVISNFPEIIGAKPKSTYLPTEEIAASVSARRKAKKKGSKVTPESLLEEIAAARRCIQRQHSVAVHNNVRELLQAEATEWETAGRDLGRRRVYAADTRGSDFLFLVEPTPEVAPAKAKRRKKKPTERVPAVEVDALDREHSGIGLCRWWQPGARSGGYRLCFPLMP